MSHEKYRDCIQACYTCAAACDHCATACLAEDNVAAMENCIRTVSANIPTPVYPH